MKTGISREIQELCAAARRGGGRAGACRKKALLEAVKHFPGPLQPTLLSETRNRDTPDTDEELRKGLMQFYVSEFSGDFAPAPDFAPTKRGQTVERADSEK